MELSSIVVIVALIAKLLSLNLSDGGVELKEVSRLSCHMSDLQLNTGYVCYKDILILRNSVYRKQDGEYQKTGTVGELYSPVRDEDMWTEYAQCGNLLVLKQEGMFLVYDMDTWKNQYVKDEMLPSWCIYCGQILYLNQERKLCCVNLQNMVTKEYDIFHADKDENVVISEFRIRDDGRIIIGKCNQESKINEFWILEMGKKGVLEEVKVWETSEWKYDSWLDFNQYGLIVLGECIGETEVVVIRDEETKRITGDYLSGEYLFLDDGYLAGDCIVENGITSEGDEKGGWEKRWKMERSVTCVSLYDYDGNRINTWKLAEDELIGQGYYLAKLIYEDGKLTGFYVQEDTDQLYISQICVNLNE